MLLEVGHDRCRDGNGADASIGLRWPEYGGAVGGGPVLLDHPHRSMEQIDALHSQRPDLAESQPAERRQQHSGPEFGLDPCRPTRRPLRWSPRVVRPAVQSRRPALGTDCAARRRLRPRSRTLHERVGSTSRSSRRPACPLRSCRRATCGSGSVRSARAPHFDAAPNHPRTPRLTQRGFGMCALRKRFESTIAPTSSSAVRWRDHPDIACSALLSSPASAVASVAARARKCRAWSMTSTPPISSSRCTTPRRAVGSRTGRSRRA